jgi:hypothetical protein
LNPAIRPAVFKQHKKLPKGFVIHLPAEFTSESVYAMLNKVPDSLKTLEPERPQYYRVNRGDNLYAISSRLGVSLNDLLVENNISRTSIIREVRSCAFPERPHQRLPLPVPVRTLLILPQLPQIRAHQQKAAKRKL